MGKAGYPMIKPLNFAYHDGRIYFHTAQEGEKIDDIRDSRAGLHSSMEASLMEVLTKRQKRKWSAFEKHQMLQREASFEVGDLFSYLGM